MRQEIFFWLLVACGMMAVLGLLRFKFALRFWVHMRRLGYLYVVFVLLLAVASIVFGRRL